MADTAALLKTLSAQLRQAQNAMFAGKVSEAQSLAESAAAGLAAAKTQDPGNVQIKTFETQLAKLQKDLAARAGKGAAASPPAAAPAAATPAPKASAQPPARAPAPASGAKPASGALPAGVAKRIRDIQALLARKKVDDAVGVLGEIDASYGGQFPSDHPDYLAARDQVAQAQAARDQASQARQQAAETGQQKQDDMRKQSEQWLVRLGAFAPHGSALFGNPSQSPDDLLAQQAAHAQALPVWQAFRAEAFPAGKSDELAALEAGLAASFEQFPAVIERSKASLADEALTKVRAANERLGQVHEGLPAILGQADWDQFEQSVSALESLLSGDGARWQALNAALADLKARDAANRADRAQKIVPQADAYAGEDADQIRQYAQQLVLKACPQARILKTVVYKPDWAESTQWEDATGTRRLVTRREIHAQAAADCAGTCRLFTLYVTKELRSDKTWSALAGNVMHHEEMAPANVNA